MSNNDRVSDLYYGRIHSPAAQNACRDRIHWLCRQVRGTRVLDVGCSQGITAIILGREGHSVVGLDVEDQAIQTARQALQQESEEVRQRVKFQVGDVFAVDFPPRSFDTVVLGELLEHLAAPEILLGRVAGWLEPGGRVVVTVPHGYEPFYDHKQTYYWLGLARLLTRDFVLVELNTVAGRYLGAVGVRPREGAKPQPPDMQTLLEWASRCEQSLAELQRHEYQQRLTLKARCQELEQDLAKRRVALAEQQKAAEVFRNLHQEQALLVADLRRQLAGEGETSQALRQRLAQLEAQLGTVEAELSRQRQTCDGLRAELNRQQRVAKERQEALERSKQLHQSLQDQYRALQAEHRQLVAQERANRQLRQRVACLQGEVDELRQTVRYRIGDAFVQASRSPVAALALPFRLAQLLVVGLRRVRARRAERRAAKPGPAVRVRPVASGPAAASGPAGEHSAPAAAVASAPAASGHSGDGRQAPCATTGGARLLEHIPSLLPPFASTPDDLIVRKDLTVAAVMDEFSWRAWQYEARLRAITPQNWKAVLEQSKPDLLLVESTWGGVDNSWYFQVRDYGKRQDVIRYYALGEIVEWCRKRGVPTVFYNKEDPPNFDVFIDAAGLFDHVFTTDANCIPEYRKHLGHDRVWALPFAAQPQIHNPVLTAPRTGSVCFAGTWYAHRHFGRQEDAEKILRPALEFGLHIFDRMAHSNNENYRWPEIFQSAVRGSLPYAEMVEAYKRYKVFININSVSNSPTMFSRRVFELLASGTPVVSAYSEGIENLLGGDVVLMSREEAQTRELLRRVLEDEDYRARLSLRGQRKVFSEHTYSHRLDTVLQVVGLKSGSTGRTELTFLAAIESVEQLAAAWENYRRQSYPGKRLIICTTSPGVAEAVDRVTGAGGVAVSVVVAEGAAWGQVMRAAADQVSQGYLVAMNPDDYYGPHYLTDLANVTLYVRQAVIGKAALFQSTYGQPPRLVSPEREYRYVNKLHPWTLCIPAELVRPAAEKLAWAQSPLEWWSRLMRSQPRMYSSDRFSYVCQADGQPADPADRPTCRLAHSEPAVMEPALV